MRDEVAHGQREALEVRLATEELWSRLCEKLPTAALTQSLTQMRLKIADEQRLAKAELKTERAELQKLATRLTEQCGQLTQQRADVQAWVAEHRRELEKHAGHLAERERQLDHEMARSQQQSRRWQSERFQLQQEIRRLLRQPATASTASAA